MTGAEITSRALRYIGKLGEGEELTGQAAEDARVSLNDMLDQWQAESLLVFAEKEDTLNLSANTASYTIGASGTFNITRPTRILRCSVTPDSTVSDPLDIPIRVFTSQEWAAIRVKSATSSYPHGIYYDRQMDSSSQGKVFVYPVPTNSNAQLVMWTPVILNTFANLTTEYVFPPGYAWALRTNLAINLSPEYGVMQPSQWLAKQAIDSKELIERTNPNDEVMVVDGALLGGFSGAYNILTDKG